MGNSTFLNLICIFGFCFPLLLTFGALGFSLVDTLRARGAAKRLGDELGWQPPPQEANGRSHWRMGVTHNRPVLIVNTSERTDNLSGQGPRFRIVLRIIMVINVPQQLDLNVWRHSRIRSNSESFETLFYAQDDLYPPKSIQNRMRHFVRLGYKTGLSRNGSLRFSPGLRDLKLAGRHKLKIGTPKNPLIPDAKAVLVTSHREPNLSVEEFIVLLDELSAVADAVEAAYDARQYNDSLHSGISQLPRMSTN